MGKKYFTTMHTQRHKLQEKRLEKKALNKDK